MSQYSLDALRQRYVVEKRPLEASIEQVLRADSRAGARAILALIDKRRFENRSEGQRLRKIDPRLKPGGKYEMANIELQSGDEVSAAIVRRLVKQAIDLNKKLGNPTKLSAVPSE